MSRSMYESKILKLFALLPVYASCLHVSIKWMSFDCWWHSNFEILSGTRHFRSVVHKARSRRIASNIWRIENLGQIWISDPSERGQLFQIHYILRTISPPGCGNAFNLSIYLLVIALKRCLVDPRLISIGSYAAQRKKEEAKGWFLLGTVIFGSYRPVAVKHSILWLPSPNTKPI